MPSQHGDRFYAELTPFVNLCGAYGLRVEFTLFTQVPLLMPRKEDRQAYVGNVFAWLRDSVAFIELVNEYDHETNGARDNWPKDADVPITVGSENQLYSKGSATADQPPMRPSWDYELYHSNDLSEWQRKVGHNAMEFADEQNVPCVSNENTRPDRDGNPDHHHDAAMGAALLCAGSCFHSNQGKLSQPFTDDENTLACARAWVEGAKGVPLEFREGRYEHHAERESSSIIRAYDKVLPDGRRYSINIRA